MLRAMYRLPYRTDRPDRSVGAWWLEARASWFFGFEDEGAQWSPSFRITKETRDDGSLAYDRFESRQGQHGKGDESNGHACP